jgi:hypothetical protein
VSYRGAAEGNTQLVLAKLAVSAMSAELTETQYGGIDNRTWPKVWARLAELRVALCEG